MRSPLETFFVDTKYKWSTYAISGAASIVYALFNILVLHRHKPEVSLETAFLFCGLLVVGILLYSVIRKTPACTSAPPIQSGRLSAFSIALAAVATLTTWHDNAALSKVQAAVIDARLEQASRTRPPGAVPKYGELADTRFERKFQDLQSIADISYRYQIPIDSKRLDKVTSIVNTSLQEETISDQTKQAGLLAYGTLVAGAALGETKAHTQPPPGYVINSHVEFSNQTLRIAGNHSALKFGDGEIEIQDSTIVFDGIDFRADRAFREVLFVSGPGSKVVIRNGTVENIDQTLDGIVWENVQFQHSMIKLRGGPFTLVNVSFKDCDLRWLEIDTIGHLRDKITQANGHPITFAYGGDGGTNLKSFP
jgi:hypothetical protein